MISRWWASFVLLICTIGIMLVMPNFLKNDFLENMPSWIPKNRLRLGLDLQGGSHLLFEVGYDTVIKEVLSAKLEAIKNTKYKDVSFSNDDYKLSFKSKNLIEDKLDGEVIIEKVKDDLYTMRMRPEVLYARKAAIIEQSIENIRRRVDESGTAEALIQSQGDNCILLQLPGVQDPERVKALLGKTAKLSFRWVSNMKDPFFESEMARVPDGSELLECKRPGRSSMFIAVEEKVIIQGDMLTKATVGFEHGSPSVHFELNSIGAKKFAEATSKGAGRCFAIVLDDEVISYPRVNEPITGGRVSITGSFSVDEASDLALLLRAGALPAPLKVIEERTVGPDLGSDSIRAGSMAAIFAVVAVCILMILVYSLFGVFANIAVVFNIILLLGVMSAFQFTLTLPGIAGIALTVGMAVDANVLVYERIKEELRNHAKPVQAIMAGYSMAMPTIIDSNITTIIGAVLLFIFGTSAVRGFAVTLIIGIVISMFTAISLVRLITMIWLRAKRRRTVVPIIGVINV